MPAQIKIEIDDEIYTKLTTLAQSRRISQAQQLRIKIVLLAAKGTPNYRIAEELSVQPNTVRKWRNRFHEGGIEKLLKELPRGSNHGGKDTKAQEKLREVIIKKTTTEKPVGQTHWSCRTMAKAVGTTHSFVNRVWQDSGLKPHLNSSFKVSNDPNFENKLRDVVGMYVDPPQKAVVFCVDEKSSIQALDRTQPGLPMKKGRAETMTHDYKRHGTSTLFAALNVATGEVYGKCKKRHRHKEFLEFIKDLRSQVNSELDLHIIVDNYSTHKHEKVRNWLKRNSSVHLHFIPTSSSWLNLVERFFGLLTDKAIRRGVFTSVKELEAAIHEFIDAHNEDPVPFVWTASVAKILDKVARARATLQKSL
jgi:transposase